MIPSLAKLCSPRNSTIRIIRYGTFPSDLDLFAQFFTFCDVAETQRRKKKKRKKRFSSHESSKARRIMASVSCVQPWLLFNRRNIMKYPPPVLPLSLKYFVVYSETTRAERKLVPFQKIINNLTEDIRWKRRNNRFELLRSQLASNERNTFLDSISFFLCVTRAKIFVEKTSLSDRSRDNLT